MLPSLAFIVDILDDEKLLREQREAVSHLQSHDLLVALVKPLREGDHDVALLQQQLLVSVHLPSQSNESE